MNSQHATAVEAPGLDGPTAAVAVNAPSTVDIMPEATVTNEAQTENGSNPTESKSTPTAEPQIGRATGYISNQSSEHTDNTVATDKPRTAQKSTSLVNVQKPTAPSNAVTPAATVTHGTVASSTPRIVQPTGYLQAYQQAQQSHNAAIAANQALANARAGITPNGSQSAMRGHAIQMQSTNRTPTVNAANYAGYQRMLNNGNVVQGQKRGYPSVNGRPVSSAGASSLPAQKYLRTAANGRAPMNNYKNHLHAQEAATRFKAAYNNAGPALVNIVENAASYFEGKDTPESIKDKERSYQRYVFNSDLLSEIFEGPLPGNVEEKDEEVTIPTSREALERVMKMSILEEVGGKMLARSHSERMAELRTLKEKYSKMEEKHRRSEKGSMRLFQKIDRATSIDELRQIRAEYEKNYDVTFVEHPPLFEKRELDHSLPHISLGTEATIVRLP